MTRVLVLAGLAAMLSISTPGLAPAQDAAMLSGPLTLQPCGRPPHWGYLRATFGGPDCAYAWQFAGIQGPDYGAFAEQLSLPAPRPVRGLRFFVTGLGVTPTTGCDAFVWGGLGGVPGPVLAMSPNWIPPAAAPTWPLVGCYDVPMPRTIVPVDSWVGYVGNWSGAPAEFYLAGDLTPTGWVTSMTNIAPGIGYPTGWNSPTIVWGPSSCRPIGAADEPQTGGGFSLGIGAWIEEEPTPVTDSTWGTIKSLFHK